MNLPSIRHRADSAYSYALPDGRVTLRVSVAAGERLRIRVLWGNKYHFSTTRHSDALRFACTDGIHDWYTVTLRPEDPRFVYIFYIENEAEAYYLSEAGFSQTYDFPLCYFSTFQLPYIQSPDVQSPPAWLQNAVFYQIFPERFACGDMHKDYPDKKVIPIYTR
ncbi:MAG: alpha amylase N-terminal ig-like domain-containing protein [Clostridiales bacterium]|nr:alpha amylase N-terminal ig-like domain-containing protein [Clostridiales bacterium]